MQQPKTVYTQGKPSITNLPKETAKVFYTTLLSKVIEYYHPSTPPDETTPSAVKTKEG